MAEQHSTPDLEEPLLTITDLRALLKVSRGGVYRLVRAGDLAPVRVGQRLRFTPEDVRQYLDQGRGGTHGRSDRGGDNR